MDIPRLSTTSLLSSWKCEDSLEFYLKTEYVKTEYFETNVEHCESGPGSKAMDSEMTIETMTYDVALMLQFFNSFVLFFPCHIPFSQF